MLRQYGRRGTIAAVVLVFITVFALFNALQLFSYGTQQAPVTRIEETTEPGQETSSNAEDYKALQHAVAEVENPTFLEEGSTADALIDGAKAALEEAEEALEPEEEQADEVTPTWPGREFPDPTPTGPSKVIVMGKMEREETGWVNELSDWKNAVYCVDLPENATCASGLKTKMNKAKEAMPYLTYLIDHYSDLPDVMAFVHAHRNGMPAAWHNDAPHHDAVRMLRELKTDHVLDAGYANLRCITEIGCPDEVQPFRSPPDDNKHAEHAYPYFYAHFFDATFDEMKANISVVATPCCAQFAVSREQVLQRELAFYERVRQFLEETHYDDDTSGRVMEYMWHVIFGREPVHCPDMFQAWCNVYGRCGLGKRVWAA